MLRPEDNARYTIDKKLIEAGWLIQKFSKINFSAGIGIAIEEFPTESGPADYALFIERKMVGIIEAKAEGTTLSKVEEQSARYASSNTKLKPILQILETPNQEPEKYSTFTVPKP
jgi:type I restriction enzyme, R subunit